MKEGIIYSNEKYLVFLKNQILLFKLWFKYQSRCQHFSREIHKIESVCNHFTTQLASLHKGRMRTHQHSSAAVDIFSQLEDNLQGIKTSYQQHKHRANSLKEELIGIFSNFCAESQYALLSTYKIDASLFNVIDFEKDLGQISADNYGALLQSVLNYLSHVCEEAALLIQPKNPNYNVEMLIIDAMKTALLRHQCLLTAFMRDCEVFIGEIESIRNQCHFKIIQSTLGTYEECTMDSQKYQMKPY